MANKVSEYDESTKTNSNSNELQENNELAQRIVIKSLTNTLAKLINENDISNLTIEEFVPTKEDDKTSWYLDLLETQLQLSKELIFELQQYQKSLKDDSSSSDPKQLKAVYYELASNTNSISSQVSSLTLLLNLSKHKF